MSKLSPAARRKARRFTLQGLYQWQLSGGTAAEIEAQFRADNDLRKTDVDYFHDLLSGSLRHRDSLDQLLTPLLDRPLQGLDPIERAVLWIGSYELQHRLDVPLPVVINESVELAKTFGATDSFRYINGVLDKLGAILRDAEAKARK